MSNVIVVDSTLKRTQIKVTPGRYLREVLEEACKSRRLNPENYTLKTANDKPVDLSQPFRLSGLTAGAKLQLTQASRSPGVLLRKFEEGVAGSGQKLNLTQRAAPSNSSSGAGRLLYEQPCLNLMGRSVEGFADLQKTLGQLGFNGGTVLVRLAFKSSGQPLEEAMTEISRHFAAVGGASEGSGAALANAGDSKANTNSSAVSDETMAEGPTETQRVSVRTPGDDIPNTMDGTSDSVPEDTTSTSTSQPQPSQTGESSSTTNGISVYRPPSNSTPAAALAPDDPSVFEPSIDQAKALQASLQTRGTNTRLKSDKELAEEESARQQQLATVRSVIVRVQYPDQHQIELTVSASETAEGLYTRIQETLQAPDEPFDLRFTGAKGQQENLPTSPSKRLVQDLGFRGRVLVRLAPNARSSAKSKQNLVLKPELMAGAKELKVELASQQAQGQAAHKEAMGKQDDGKKDVGKGKGKAAGDVEAKMKKFLGFGKK
ncbi:hypothetical protein LTR78_002523 [Recurvomyces mirabilis]|uniref:TUG ubiquitin-like domain-containing protein n=1 Tax=Recurvomyces mirabilis TaxID=574656 RepID=A0AAE0WTT1_9PEZI|nr:hypothetical protein LTR78_002523 [Recurvomyces mirabilis]KAK5157452.1 hypothetical protein LTS14_004217 [Recurvomyces mirabilis]